MGQLLRAGNELFRESALPWEMVGIGEEGVGF